MALLKPISLKSPLAPTPEKLFFKTHIEDIDGNRVEVSDPKAIRAMVALMDMQAVMGGAASHWGGPSALTEMWSALHALVFNEAKLKSVPWYELYNLVNDAGHCENGLYAIKANYGFADLSIESLKGFRSISSPLTGHGESHLFPEGVLVSNGHSGPVLVTLKGLVLQMH